MYLPSHSSYILLLYLSIIITAIPQDSCKQVQPRSTAFAISLFDQENYFPLLTLHPFYAGPVDEITHGNYRIYNCGTHVPAVQTLLDLTIAFLQTALAACTPSNRIYATFFHQVPPARVKAILQKIIEGQTLDFPKHPFLDDNFQPTILCVIPESRKLESLMAHCNQPPTPAGILSNTPFTFLCPNFLKLRRLPSSDGCPTVLRGKFLHGGHDMTFSQMTILIHELAHLYIGKEALRQEVYDANEAMRLPTDLAWRNAQNYALFVGSFIAGCTQFPTSRALNRDGRELLKAGHPASHLSDAVQLPPGCPKGSVQAILGLCKPSA
ncbi:MAG: hypothetical protein Q9187_009267 [Circinaria calcarea]